MLKPGRRELNKIKCRQKILKKARRLFTTKGYDSTTIGDVAQAAEVSKATLYNYFPSKETLLLGIADAALEEARALIRKDLAQELSALAKLRRVIGLLAADGIRYISLTRRMLYLNAFPESGLYVTRQQLKALLLELVAQAQTQGELRQDVAAETLSEIFLGIYLTTQFAWEDIEQCTEEECAQRVDALIDRALAGLGPKEEG